MKTIFVSILLIILFLIVSPSYACKPGPNYPMNAQDNFDAHPVVFVGTVISTTNTDSTRNEQQINFSIDKTYKGTAGQNIVVTTSISSASCGYDDIKNVFKKGSVWTLYADENFNTTSLYQNKEFKSASEAITQMNKIDSKPKICTLQYDPVCAKKDTGIRCITTPCPSSEIKTYGNKCMMNADDAEFLYDGECITEELHEAPPNIQSSSSVSDTIIDTVTNTQKISTTTEITQEPKIYWWTTFKNWIIKQFFFWR